MSEAQEHESVRVSAEGVRVLKRYAAEEFPVPAIAFDITSGREDAVTVTLSDTIPEDIDIEDLGFHPDHGSEHWTVGEDEVTFEREIEPDSTYTTVYGIRVADDIEQFLTEPSIESVDPPLPEDAADGDGDILLESDDSLVEEAVAENLEKLEEDEEEGSKTDGEIELDIDEDEDEDEEEEMVSAGANSTDEEGDEMEELEKTPSTTEQSTADAGAQIPEDALVISDDETLIEVLAEELENGDAPDDDISVLKDGLTPDPDGKTKARLEQLETDVNNLRAYAGAIEEFLDENGGGAEMIEEFKDRLDSFEDQFDRIESEVVNDIESTVDRLESNVTQIEGTVDNLEETVDSVESDVKSELDDISAELDERIDQQLQDIENQLAEVEEKAEAGPGEEIEAQLNAVEEMTDEIKARLDETEDSVAEMKDTFSSLGG